MAQTGQRDDPFLQFNFLVEIDGVTRAGFTDVSGLTTDTGVIEYREGGDVNNNVRKLPALHTYTNLTLKRGWTPNIELWLWRKDIINGIVVRKSIDIIALNETRDPVLRWRVREAWISKWESGPFSAKANEALMEMIEVAHEGLSLVE